MSFTNPDAFLLLLLIPIFMRLGWPRLAYRRRRDTVALVVRIILILTLILALAGLQIRREADKLAVVFLVDVSDSMDETSQRQALEYVRRAIDEMGEDDQAAVVLFGSNALVEHPMDALVNLNEIGSEPVRLNTDIAEAIRLGLALFPPDAAKRMVILSDGLETVGDAVRASQLAAATDVQIDYVPFGIVRDREVLVNSVRVPSVVGENEPFDLVVSLENKGDSPTDANLTILAAGSAIHTAQVTLRPGMTQYAIGPLEFPSAQFVDFRVLLEPITAEGFQQNNQLSAFTQVSGRPRVLVVANDPAETQYLEAALTDAGLLLDVVTPAQMPLGLAPLSTYRSVILVNVPAADLTPRRMELLEIYVRDLGGGLIAIGGPDSYGVGGYFETELEDVLPVEMRIKDQERIPQLTMVYVIDRSGSMEITGPSGFTNLELAKEAVLRSMNFLNNYDRAGVVSFDHQAFWVVDIQEIGDAANRQQIEDRVGSLRAGGGTDIFGGLNAVDSVLPSDPSTLKHIILLTDGGANPSGITSMVGRMHDSFDITTSVVAIGEDYAPWLRDVAAHGGGNFHATSDVESIPAIFSAETVLATRSYIFEEPFTPAITAPSPIIDGVDLNTMPPLLGYVATTPKETATVIMTGPEEDPILVSWQYGLGRSVAFTSDATLRWGTNWVNGWGDYTRFWNQVVRWTITEGTDSNLDVWVEERGEDSVVVVDARDNSGNYLNALDLEAAIVLPGRETVSPQFHQVAPGRYEASFKPTDEGAYFIRVYGGTSEDAPIEATVAQNTGWVLSYSPEYRVNEPDAVFLQQISRTTNGSSLAGNPASAFVHNLEQEEAALPLWPYLLGLAAVLLVVDIAVRRLVINQSDLERMRETVLNLVGRRESRYDETEYSERMSDLMRAKQRAQGEAGSAEGDAAQPAPAATAIRHTRSEAKHPQQPSKPESQQDKKQVPKPGEPPKARPAAGDKSTASQLLKKKRERS
ncbi:MAG: VWA domain-containing protein [Chloroflexi bacterium]|nr:VWA domain-containing protein [Chloroflexota bacterium]